MIAFIKNLFRGLFNKTKIYHNDGTPSSDSELDRLRGMHSGRAKEQMEFSLSLKRKRLNKPIHEWFEPNHVSGAAPIEDDLSGITDPDDIKQRLWNKGGMYYTGRVKTYEWEYNNMKQFQCLAEKVYWDRSYQRFVHSWGGPQPGPGYYGADKWVWIEGEEPLIKGALYQPNDTYE